MTATELWGYLIGAIGVLVGVAGWLRNTKGDTSQQAGWMGKVDAKLDHITNELAQLANVSERVALVESSAKALEKQMEHHRKYEHCKGE